MVAGHGLDDAVIIVTCPAAVEGTTRIHERRRPASAAPVVRSAEEHLSRRLEQSVEREGALRAKLAKREEQLAQVRQKLEQISPSEDLEPLPLPFHLLLHRRLRGNAEAPPKAGKYSTTSRTHFAAPLQRPATAAPIRPKANPAPWAPVEHSELIRSTSHAAFTGGQTQRRQPIRPKQVDLGALWPEGAAPDLSTTHAVSYMGHRGVRQQVSMKPKPNRAPYSSADAVGLISRSTSETQFQKPPPGGCRRQPFRPPSNRAPFSSQDDVGGLSRSTSEVHFQKFPTHAYGQSRSCRPPNNPAPFTSADAMGFKATSTNETQFQNFGARTYATSRRPACRPPVSRAPYTEEDD